MKKYLVTGGAGFIGSNFIKYMLRYHEDIFIVNLDKLTYAGNLENLNDVCEDKRYKFVKGDICNIDLLIDLFRDYDFDYVVNFAAESHVDRSIMNPSIFVETNVMGTLKLLRVAQDFWLKDGVWREGVKFLQVSTDEVYGTLRPEDPPFKETNPIDPHSPYSASKASADHFVKAFHDTYGMPINITRCSNNYGPYQFPEKLIPLMIYNAKNHKPLPIYGDGKQRRDWLYVEDHCSAIDLVISEGRVGEVYNIGGQNRRNEFCNLHIVESIIRCLRDYLKDPEINFDLIHYIKDRPGHDRRYSMDSSKIRKELGWEESLTFEQGFFKTIDWYLENEEWVDHIISEEYKRYYDQMYKEEV